MVRHQIAQVIDNQLRRWDSLGNELPAVPVGGHDWQVWLNAQETRSFAYHTPYGALTVRRELRKEAWYWYGYHSREAKLRKIYLGKAEALTPQRLHEAARKLARPQTQRNDLEEPRSEVRHSSTLLRTRLVVPSPPRFLISRPRLLQIVRDATSRSLTLLCAPAGFGKTTLLSQWANDTVLPVAWLSLHEELNDPHCFFAYLVEALQPLCPGIGYAALNTYRAQPCSLTEALTALVNELVLLKDDCLLVLDHYHAIERDAIHNGLKFLLENRPARLHLVVATRSALPFSPARLYAQGQVIEVRASALRFTQEETRAFLSAATDQLSAEEIGELDRQTEGWAAGLQMAASALQSGEARLDGERPGGENRYVRAYLLEEVLHRLPAHVQAFVCSTAPLDAFNGPLCRAAAEQAEAEVYLEQLAREDLFLVPLAERKGWYRYHRLFAQTLRAHLEHTRPDLVPALYRRASRWLENAGNLEEAINYSLAAGEAQRAALLIEQVAHTLLENGETACLQRWLEALPAEIIRSSPRLCITSAWLLFLTTQAPPFISWLDAAEEALDACEEHLSAEAAATLQSEIFALRSTQLIHFNDFGRVVATCNRLLASLSPENTYARSLLLLMLGLAYQRGINVSAAAQALSEASSYSQAIKHALIAPYIMIGQAELYESLASPFQALQLYQQTLKLTNGRAGHPYGITMASMGYLFWEWQNLEVARKYLLQAWNIGQEICNSNVIFNSGFLLALLSQALGYTQEASSWLQRLDMYAQEVGIFDATETLNALRALLALEQGRLEDALLWARRRPAFCGDEMFQHNETEDHILARILLVAARTYGVEPYLPRAQALLDYMRRNAETIGKQKTLIEVLTLQALLKQQQGENAKALTLLEQALVLAEPGRYIRVFVDKGDAMAMLLRQLRDHSKTRATRNPRLNLAYVRKLLTSFTPPAAHPVQSASPQQLPVEVVPLLEPLSWREQEVLRLLAAGRKNQEIARELVIVTGTVKSHTNSIYRKLAVNSRVQAIARARALHLL